jgi:hypothetical protein
MDIACADKTLANDAENIISFVLRYGILFSENCLLNAGLPGFICTGTALTAWRME